MKNIWYFLMLFSLVFMLFYCPEKTVPAIMDAGQNALELCLKLLGIYAVFLGFLGIVDETKLSEKISSLLEPFIDFLFGKNLDKQTKNFIALNISSNILGIGNASTPMGIKAMQKLDKINNSNIASTAMIMLVVINATSLQLLPTTIIGLRARSGSVNSSDIILPSVLTTCLTTVLGIVLVKLFSKIKFKKIKKV